MSIFDERLRRLKHASQMAVTQRDHPRSDAALAAIPTPPTPLSPWSPALPSRPGGAQPSGAVAVIRSGPRRVTARLLSAPSGPAGPDDLTDWTPAAPPEWNAQPSLDAPLLTEARRSPAPPPGPAAAQPSPAPRPPASPPAPLMNDPYGDVEEALAAGLSAHPPLGLLPPEPLPARAATREEGANRPSPLRPASFMETMALNTPPAEAPGNREDGPEPAQKPAQETSPDTRPQEAAPAEQAARAVSAAPAGQAAPAEVTAWTPDVPVSPADQDLPGSPTPAPASPERPPESAPAAVARPPGQTAGSDGTAPDAASDGEEPALVFPEILPPDVRERQQQERRELEQLLKSGNNDIPVRLPRRPRPQVAPIAAPVVEEDVKPAPPIPQEVSQNILARLNRFAELEEKGEVEASALGVGQLHTWQDHHPERNVSLPPAGLDADAAVDRAAPPRADQPGARGSVTPRLRARASRSGRSADRSTPDGGPSDPDEEPDTAGRARTGGAPPDAAPSPARPTPDRVGEARAGESNTEASAPPSAPLAAQPSRPAEPLTRAAPERAAPDRTQPDAYQTDPGGVAAPPVTPAPVPGRANAEAVSPGPDPAAGSVQRRTADVPFPDGPAVEPISQPGPAPAPVRPDVFTEPSGEPDAPSVMRPDTDWPLADAPADTNAANTNAVGTDATGTAAGSRKSVMTPSVPVILPHVVAPLESDHAAQPPTPVVSPTLAEPTAGSAAPTAGPTRVSPLTAASVGPDPLPSSAAPPALGRRTPRPETPPAPVPVRPAEPRPTPVIPTAEAAQPDRVPPRPLRAERPADPVVTGQPDDRAAASATVLPVGVLPGATLPSVRPAPASADAFLPGAPTPLDLGDRSMNPAEPSASRPVQPGPVQAEDRPVTTSLPVTDAPPVPPQDEAVRDDARASEPPTHTLPEPVEPPAPVESAAPTAPPVPALASAPAPAAEAALLDHLPDQLNAAPRPLQNAAVAADRLVQPPAPAMPSAQTPEAAAPHFAQPTPAPAPSAPRPDARPPSHPPLPVTPVAIPPAPEWPALESPLLTAPVPVRPGEATGLLNPTPMPLEARRDAFSDQPLPEGRSAASPVRGEPRLSAPVPAPAALPVQAPVEGTAELPGLPGGQSAQQEARAPVKAAPGPAGVQAPPTLPSPHRREAPPVEGAPVDVTPTEVMAAAPGPQSIGTDGQPQAPGPVRAGPVLPTSAVSRLAAEDTVTGPVGAQPALPAPSLFAPSPFTPSPSAPSLSESPLPESSLAALSPLRPVPPVEVTAGSDPVRPVPPAASLSARPLAAAPLTAAPVPVQRQPQAESPAPGQPDVQVKGARGRAEAPQQLRPPAPVQPVPVMPAPPALEVPVTDLPVSAAATRPVESLPAQTIPTPALTLPTLPQPVLPVPPVVTLPVQATGPLSPETWPVAAAPAPGQPFAVAVPPDRVPAVAVAPDAFAADSPGAPVPARAASGPGDFALPAPVVPSWFPASPAPVLPALGEASWPGETSLEGVLEGSAGSGFQPAGAAPPAGLTVPVTVPVPLPVSVLPVSAPLPESVPGLPGVGRSPVLPVSGSTLPLPGAVPLPETVSVPVPPVGGSPVLWDDVVRAALPSLFGAGPQIRAAVPGLVPVVLPVVGAAAPQAVLPGAQTSPPPGSRPGAELPVVPGVQAVTPLGVPLAGAPQGPGLNGPQSQVLRALQAAVRQDGHGQPLAPGAQASLARLMGTSVADVRVIRNAGVPAALQAAQADALTVGRTVFLSPDTPLDSGAGRALAAHEFTHALRQKNAGFVPDVLRRAPGRPDSSAEEAVALATEHASVHGPDGSGQTTPMRRLPGLPAPWEPLPWETGSFGAGHGDRPDPSTWGEAHPAREFQSPLPAADRPALPPGLGLQSAGLAGPGGLGNVVNAAATDRAKPQEARDTQAGAPPVGRRAQGTPSVDLDQVAREVYARLRERLSSELRRH